MRRKNKKFKQDETETSASERTESSEQDNTNEENHDESIENSSDKPEPETKKRKRVSFSPKKAAKEKKDKEEKENAQADADNGEVQHEVEAIVDEKMVRGVKHYLIRWKGYSEDADTWEPESTVNCPDLIKQFLSNRKNNSNLKSKKQKEIKTKNKKKNNIKKKDSRLSKDSNEDDWDENEEFEVERILEVHHKRDGSREFLVSWKGYPQSQNSWVVEEDMTCSDLIAKFMAKVERAKLSAQKELRVKPAHTDRFTLATKEPGRRLSKRNWGKQSIDRSTKRGRRVQYHDAE
ncbi:hypothetical protein Trydic_g111 [Trypoxylus dichotomus]